MQQARSSNLRIFLGVVAFVFLISYFQPFSLRTANNIMASTDASYLSDIKVTIEQTSSNIPPKIKATVTNTGDKPLTFIEYDSPLDKAIFALGKIQIVPDGETTPIRLSVIQYRRIWPPQEDSLVELLPGESKSQEVEIREPTVRPDKLPKKATAKMGGRWMGVWQMAKKDVVEKYFPDMEDHTSYKTGDFSSNTMELVVD